MAHEKAAAASDNNSQSTPNDAEAANSKETTHSKSNKTSIIVGVVVGVGGALILGGLLAWWFLRRRQQRRGREIKEKDAGLVASEGASTPTCDASSNSSGEEHGNLPASVPAAHLGGPPPSYGRPSLDNPSASRRPPTPGATAVLAAPSRQGGNALRIEERRTPQPALKAEYARAFGTETAEHDTPSPPLKQEYKRAFGPRPLQHSPPADRTQHASEKNHAHGSAARLTQDKYRPAFRLSTEL